MDTEVMIREISAVAEKHKNDFVPTCQTNITAMCMDIIPKLEELKIYEDLDKQGKLLKLPCKVGDTIYIVLHNHTITKRKVIEFKMVANRWAAEVSDWFYLLDDFGKTIFLNKEEAETALQKINKLGGQ